jgi:hypothetical protein
LPDRQFRCVAAQNGEVQAKTAFLVYRSHLQTDHQLLSGCREGVRQNVNGARKGEEVHDRARRQRPARQKTSSVFL